MATMNSGGLVQVSRITTFPKLVKLRKIFLAGVNENKNKLGKVLEMNRKYRILDYKRSDSFISGFR